MSLTKDAIQLITDTALAANGKKLETLVPTVVLPESSKVIDLERFQAGRAPSVAPIALTRWQTSAPTWWNARRLVPVASLIRTQ